MYKVIAKFRDLTDGHLYNTGDTFPHDGREIPQDRINALISGQNGASKALIAQVEQDTTPAAQTPKKASRGRKKAQ